VILLPLHHPVKLAEEVITLDIVSRGRFILGVGLGYQPVDFRTFDIPIEQRVSRFEEEIEIIRQCWKGERFDFSGEHFNLEDVAITPRPYSDPSPPLWIGASRAPGARRAGTIADGFVAGPSTDLESTITLTSAYQQAAQAAGKEPVLCLMRDSWVAPTRAEAELVYGPAVIDAYKYYWRNGLNEFRRHTVESDINMTNMAPDRLIIGEPEEVVGDFHRWKEATGADYFLLRLRHAHSGGPPHERIMEAIQLFGEEVIPNCQ
jgi:alkanesulfonate monooxygenase SsuD/methylene tetrahydromethanopterin reductase-like flavin-dependent oxidoreductase (luciferase family)